MVTSEYKNLPTPYNLSDRFKFTEQTDTLCVNLPCNFLGEKITNSRVLHVTCHFKLKYQFIYDLIFHYLCIQEGKISTYVLQNCKSGVANLALLSRSL